MCFAHSDSVLYGNNYAIQAFGHVHSQTGSTSADIGRLQYLYPTQYDVGVDNNNYFPISWEELNNKINSQIELWKQQ